MGVRPERVFNDDNGYPVKVELVEHLGQFSLIHCVMAKTKCVFKVKGWIDLAEGSEFKVGLDLDKCFLFDNETGQRLRG